MGKKMVQVNKKITATISMDVFFGIFITDFEQVLINELWGNNFFEIFLPNICILFSGNKAKGRISKQVFQENKARQIFRKKKIFYPLIRTRTCGIIG